MVSSRFPESPSGLRTHLHVCACARIHSRIHDRPRTHCGWRACLSVGLSIYLSVSLSVGLSVGPVSVCLPACLYISHAHHLDVIAVGARVGIELLSLLDEGIKSDELVRPLHVVNLSVSESVSKCVRECE